jgi:membrane-associated phospholipid phosphatase
MKAGRGVRPLLFDTAAIAAGVVAYFRVRGLTEGSTATAVEHAEDVLLLERTLGLDLEAGLQAAVAEVPAVVTVANWVYVWAHWPAIVATLLWLAVAHRRVFRRLRDAMAVSGAMGLCVYVSYPVAPPRLARLGMTDTVTEQSQAYRLLQPPAFTNQYAAMPSLHVGWNLLLGLALVAAAGGGLLMLIGRTTPWLMAVATVITANHFVLDVLLGAAFGLVGWTVAGWLEARRQTNAGRPPPQVLPADALASVRS